MNMALKTSCLPDLFSEIGNSPDFSDVRKKSGHRPSRRKFLKYMFAGGVLSLVGSGSYVYWIEPTWLEISRQKMNIANLPPDFEGFRIVQLSDLHVGSNVPTAYLQKCIDKANQRKPDLVVVTGDIVHHGRTEWNDPAARLLARIQAKYGVMAILGNHDWGASTMGSGFSHWADKVMEALMRNNIHILRNQSMTINKGTGSLYIAGMDDYWAGNFKPSLALADVPPSAPCIALCHNPDGFVDLLDRQVCWTLSGHTHGGQVNIPFYGPPIVPTRHKQFVAGHYQVAKKNLYVNRGLGWLKRVRFNARPEITEFTLTCA